MYRGIETSFWDDPKVKTLDPAGKLGFLYLITNRHSHVSGIYILQGFLAQHETGLSDRVWHRVSDTLSELGLACFDGKTDVVWVVNMFGYQGRGEKNERAAAAHLASLHNSTLVRDFLRKYPAVERYISDRVSDRVSDTSSELRQQEQEQEQEREQEQEQEETDRPPSGTPGAVAPSPAASPNHAGEIAQVIDHYRKLHPHYRGGTKDKTKIRQRLAEGYTVEQLQAAIDGCHRTPYNLGENKDAKQYLSLELIVRDAKHVTQFLETPAVTLVAQPMIDKSKRAIDNWLRMKEIEDEQRRQN